MSHERWTAVDTYLNEQLLADDPVLTDATRAAESAGLPPISVAPNQGKLLHLVARMIGARRILEIGTLGGYSAIWMARALPPDGKLVTLELEPRHADVARANFLRAGLSDRIDLKLGVALASLNALQTDADFDLVFIDADKQSCAEYFAWALAHTRVGGVIIVDNVVRNGEVVNAQSVDDGVNGVRRFLEAVRHEPRVDATALQTVGTKGYDGLALLLVVSK